jgi:hypothetical protein
MMQRAIYAVLPAMAVVCALVVVGCPSGTTVDTEKVQGTVTLDGEPVAGATVTFVPVNEGQGMSATGVTDAQGKYTLNPVGGGQLAAEAGAGTLAGEYYVGVLKSEMDIPLTEEEAEEQGVEYVAPEGEASGEITHIVPQKYNNPRESGIKVTVTEGENMIPIEISSQ